MKKLLGLLTVAVLALAGCGSSEKSLAAEETLTIGITPTTNPEIVQQAADLWTEQLTPIFKDMGYDFELDIVVTPDANATTEGVASGSIGVGFVPASNYLVAEQKNPDAQNVLMQGTRYEYNPDGTKNYEATANAYDSALYVNTDLYNELGMSTWSNEDYAKWLTNGETTVATSSYTSSSSYVWPVNFIVDNNQDPNEINWVKVDNHYSTVQQVADGNADAAFGFLGVNQDVKKQGNENYADIDETVTVAIQNVGQVRVPNDVAIINSEFDEQSQDDIYKAFEIMASTESGREALSKAYNWVGVARVSDEDETWKVVSEYMEVSKKYAK
jgi:ABC-type phosphate/phosphonate transport system substrate-binding protein